MDNSYSNFKCVLLGNTDVGKSSLAFRYINNIFNNYGDSTVGAAFMTKFIDTESGTVKLEIWDTAGQERYESLCPMYYRNAHIIIIIFDITSNESYEKAKKWVDKTKKNGVEAIYVFVGNKCDQEDKRKISTNDAQRYAIENDLQYYETSAKNNINVTIIFECSISKARQIYGKGIQRRISLPKPLYIPNNKPEKNSDVCPKCLF